VLKVSAVHPLLVHPDVLFVVFLQNSYSIPPTHASLPVVLATRFVVHEVYAGSATIVTPVGAVVSRRIVLVRFAVVVPPASLHLI
jgi:hypothetical protein